MIQAPAPLVRSVKAAQDARIAMSAAWLCVSYLDGQGVRRRLSDDFKDAFEILKGELAEAGYLERYRDAETGALRLPPIEPSGVRNYAADADAPQNAVADVSEF